MRAMMKSANSFSSALVVGREVLLVVKAPERTTYREVWVLIISPVKKSFSRQSIYQTYRIIIPTVPFISALILESIQNITTLAGEAWIYITHASMGRLTTIGSSATCLLGTVIGPIVLVEKWHGCIILTCCTIPSRVIIRIVEVEPITTSRRGGRRRWELREALSRDLASKIDS